MSGRPSYPRTLLARIILNSDKTIEEHCHDFLRRARQLNEHDATLSVRQLSRWMKGEVPGARKPARRVARDVWGHSFDELVALVDVTNSVAVTGTPAASLDDRIDRALGVSQPAALTEEIEMAAEEASRFVRRAGVSVTPELLGQLDADVRSLAAEYLRFPPYAVFRRIASLRGEVFDLLDRHPRPECVRDLYRIAGRVSALIAHASNDLGHPDAADAHARTAWLCADLSGDRRLGAYIRWVQSSVAYWRGDYRSAAEIARSGRAVSTHADDGLRLASQEARSFAAARNELDANSALVFAADIRERVAEDSGSSDAGVFTFGSGKAAYYASEARLALGGSANVRHAIQDATDSLELLRLSDGHDNSVELVAAARLDLILALLASSDLDAAAVEVDTVLLLPSESRTLPVMKRAVDVYRVLDVGEFRQSALAVGLRERIDTFQAYPATRELPSI